MATAFFCSINTTSFLPRVTPSVEKVPLQHRKVLGHDGDNDGWIFGTLALVDCGGIGRNQHVELAKSVGDGSAVEKSDKFFCSRSTSSM